MAKVGFMGYIGGGCMGYIKQVEYIVVVQGKYNIWWG